MLRKNQGKSEETNPVSAIIDSIMNWFHEAFSNGVSLDDFAHKSNTEIDKRIMQEIQKGNKYETGRFFIQWDNSSVFHYGFEMYFKSKQNEWLELKGTSPDVPLGYLLPSAKDELKVKGRVVYDIDEPDFQNNNIARSNNENDTGTSVEPMLDENPSVNEEREGERHEEKSDIMQNQSKTLAEILQENMMKKRDS